MSSRADLHCHTTYSDGSLTPSELVDRAVQRGVEVMALTDHDCTDGIPEALEAASRHPGFLLIPGIELSTDVPEDEVHVLGYFIDWESPAFQKRLHRLRDSRLSRGRAMLAKLRELGIELRWERVQEAARTLPWRCWREATSRLWMKPSSAIWAATVPPTWSARRWSPPRPWSSSPV